MKFVKSRVLRDFFAIFTYFTILLADFAVLCFVHLETGQQAEVVIVDGLDLQQFLVDLVLVREIENVSLLARLHFYLGSKSY